MRNIITKGPSKGQPVRRVSTKISAQNPPKSQRDGDLGEFVTMSHQRARLRSQPSWEPVGAGPLSPLDQTVTIGTCPPGRESYPAARVYRPPRRAHGSWPRRPPSP